MLTLQLNPHQPPRALRVLCLGAHSDDIEIGCAGTLLRWQTQHPLLDITWVVFSAPGERAAEARRSAKALCKRGTQLSVVLGDFDDTALPADLLRAKTFMRQVAKLTNPDVVLTHRLEDRHQDHKLVAELTWQTFRNHWVLEYEIAKYEGDLGQPNFFVPLTAATAARKTRHLLKHFGSQRSKNWFNERSFNALMALRGLECHAASGWAEAFHVRKAVM